MMDLSVVDDDDFRIYATDHCVLLMDFWNPFLMVLSHAFPSAPTYILEHRDYWTLKVTLGYVLVVDVRVSLAYMACCGTGQIRGLWLKEFLFNTLFIER